MPGTSDMELWTAAHGGNRDAFGNLFRRHYPLLFQYGSKMASPPVVEDCIQELFAELWQKKSGKKVGSVKAYLLQALKFKIYRQFRDTPKDEAVSEESGPFELSHDNFISAREDQQEKLSRVIQALAQLPPRQKEVIYLKLYKGLNYEELAQVMNLNYQSVRNLFSQALKSFRQGMTTVQ
jgi:RNA polymerase sigma factor (sigma-70 family)